MPSEGQLGYRAASSVNLSLAPFLHLEAWISLATLTGLEIVLGIDNIVVLSIVSARLPPSQRPRARRIGLLLALAMRVGLLMTLTWVMGLKRSLFTLFGHGFSGRDVILIAGGLFLVGKSTQEIHAQLEGEDEDADGPGAETRRGPKFLSILLQIAVLDVVFSLDSIITAVGMAQELVVMIGAVIAAVGIMIGFANVVGDFVNEHPSIKTLALAFLILIGVLLIADAMGQHVSKAYVYVAMAFAVCVEGLNMRISANEKRRRAELRKMARRE
jgi:predicted tellurium resistance membrane protein TerC